jgi:hypothetical protein
MVDGLGSSFGHCLAQAIQIPDVNLLRQLDRLVTALAQVPAQPRADKAHAPGN